MTILRNQAIARITNRKGNDQIGVGFLVSENHVMTCAHVVAEAINADFPGSVSETDRKGPPQKVYLDFPLAAPNQPIEAEVEEWCPALKKTEGPYNPELGPWDVAILRLTEQAPESTAVAPFIFQDLPSGVGGEAWGVPKRRETKGTWARCEIRDALVGGRIEIDVSKEPEEINRIWKGFSGSGVWVEHEDIKGFVGMVVRVRGDRERGEMIPMAALREILPVIPDHLKIQKFCEVLGWATYQLLPKCVDVSANENAVRRAINGRPTVWRQLKIIADVLSERLIKEAAPRGFPEYSNGCRIEDIELPIIRPAETKTEPHEGMERGEERAAFPRVLSSSMDEAGHEVFFVLKKGGGHLEIPEENPDYDVDAAILQVREWKKLHTMAEAMLSSYLPFIKAFSIYYAEAMSRRKMSDAVSQRRLDQYLGDAQKNLGHVKRELGRQLVKIQGLEQDLRTTDPIVVLEHICKCDSALNYTLSILSRFSDNPDDQDLKRKTVLVKQFVERVQGYFQYMLQIADEVIEAYLASH
jgi:hypothetical protein